MKRATMFALACLLAAAVPAHSQSNPSTQETLDWLAAKVAASGSPSVQSYGYADMHYSDFRYANGILTYHEIAGANATTRVLDQTVSVPLKAINAQHGRVLHLDKTTWAVAYVTRDEVKTVQQKGQKMEHGQLSPFEYSNNGFALYLSDQDTAERVKNALDHLIELSGATSEPF